MVHSHAVSKEEETSGILDTSGQGKISSLWQQRERGIERERGGGGIESEEKSERERKKGTKRGREIKR